MREELKGLSLYEVLVLLADTHEQFEDGGYADGIVFDLYNKTISKGKTCLMKNGKVIPQTLKLKYGLSIVLTEDMEIFEQIENPYEELERRYKEYKYSVPNPYTKYIKHNFIAKDINELSIKQITQNKPRQLARIELEAFVMFQEFPWTNPKYHFWQSQSDKSLLIYKEWSEGIC